MIPSLSKYDNITAAGILARAALSLEDEYNPATTNQFSDELEIRESIIREFREKIGINPGDSSHDALDRLADALDLECDSLIEKPNDYETLKRLADKGELPSDVFEISIIDNIKIFFGRKYDTEKNIIEETIRFPDREQHYGPPSNQNDPFLISLFSKNFPNKNPRNSFTMLVAGCRDSGVKLSVHQAWRIYKEKKYVEKFANLVDLLRNFADEFGAEIEVGGKRGNFFLTTDIQNNTPNQFKVNFKNNEHASRKRSNITISHFVQNNQGEKSKRASLIVAIDLIKYRKMLKSHGW